MLRQKRWDEKLKGILEKLCIDALENYYRYGTADFVDAFDENIVFFSPNDNRVIKGKENVVKYFTEGGKKLKLSIDNLSTQLISLKADAVIVIADYNLFAYYPDGKMLRFKQHYLVALNRKRSENGSFEWKCPLIHISNVGQKASMSNTEKITLRQYEQDLIRSIFADRKSVRKIVFSGDGNVSHYIAEDSIKYIEGGKGVQCYVHTDSGIITVHHLMKDVIEKLPDYYYRCHASYIVNLRRVKSVGSYKVFLESGEEIPVPAKKYGQVKSDITRFISQS